MRGKANLNRLDHTKGGIPETSKIKNRTAMLVFDREKDRIRDAKDWFENAFEDLYADKIDTIVIDVKRRTWHNED